jgi:nitrile hydratase
MSFAPGTRVTVRNDWPEAKGAKVHIRTPHFVRGKTGRIETLIGEFGDPEYLAVGRKDAPKRALYMVVFDRAELFPGTDAHNETLTADLYENWLEPAP